MDIFRKVQTAIQKRQAKKQERIRLEFLPEALEIVEKPVSPTGHLLIIVLGIIVLFFVIWSIWGKMDEVVTARGIIITVSGVQEVQAISDGVVEEITVQEGSSVKAGESIVKINSTINEITLQNTTENLKLLEYENELLSEIAGGNDISQGAVPEKGSDEEVIYNYVKSMQDGFLAEKSELDNVVNQTKAEVEIEKEALDKISASNQYLVAQKEALDSMLSYSNTEELMKQEIALKIAYTEKKLADYEMLYEAGAIAKSEMEELEAELRQLKKELEIQSSNAAYENYENSLRQSEIDNQLILAEKDYSSQKNAVDIAQAKYEQALAGLNTLEKEYQANIISMVVQNTNNINTHKSNQEIQRIGVKEMTLVSPVDGVVRTLEIDTIGGVVAAAQTVATIVPDEAQMIVEVDIRNKDIGYIENGQEVVLKLDTFDFQEYGKMEGVVVHISPDAVWSDAYGWVYKAKINIDEEKFKQKNPNIEIGVGMECTAEVKVGERRIIDFFLEPLVEHFDGSLKIK